MATMTRRTGNIVAGILALVLTAFLVIRTSSAVFTARTENLDNTVAAGTLLLEDNDAGAVLFNVANMAPGEFEERCIEVTYTGTLDPLVVRAYSTSVFVTDTSGHPVTNPASVAGTSMEDVVNISIEQGSATATDCTGWTADAGGPIVGEQPAGTTPTTLAAWHAADTGYASGSGTWTPTLGSDVTKWYRITLELDPATGNEYQGVALSGISITWETQSN